VRAHQLPVLALWVQFGATIAIAIGAAWIGFQQWRTANDRLVMDLFDRRFKIYDDVAKLVHDVSASSHVDDQTMSLFYLSTHQVKFLFGTEVEAYFEEIRVALRTIESTRLIRKRNEGRLTKEALDANIDKADEALKFLRAYSANARIILDRYISLRHKVARWPFKLRG
jgi:hypothetical protein